jgi:sugar lactone lactonase YvrE
MKLLTALPLLGSVSLLACTPPKPLPEVNEPKAEPKQVELEVSKTTPLPEPSVDKPLTPPPEPEPSVEPILKFTGAFATPESVLYDAAADRYLVSNVNGQASAADGNGYILELSPDGKVTNPKLIAGGMNKVRLDAPKGLAIVGTELWVADITLVRKFDLKTSAHKADIELPGATFANDIVAAPDGGAYVSDSAVKFGDNGMEATGPGQVYFVDKAGKVKVLAKSKELGGPNGLAMGPGKALLVNTIGSDEVYQLTDKGARDLVTKVPGGQLDGLLSVDDMLIVSSWKTETVYRGPLGGTFTPLLTKVKAVADIGYDSKRKRLLVPRFLDDTVEVYDLK